jgi:hypothetical protein
MAGQPNSHFPFLVYRKDSSMNRLIYASYLGIFNRFDLRFNCFTSKKSLGVRLNQPLANTVSSGKKYV